MVFCDQHNTDCKLLLLKLHCAFSMWAYGSPEIWPEGVEAKTEDGQTTYYAKDRSFTDRLFNENSFPFFVLMFVLMFFYFVDLILENFIMRIFFKVDNMVDMNQRTYTKNKHTMARFSQISYDPELNEEYAKILLAMKDVAVIKKGYLLVEIKEEYGSKVMLIPIAADNDLPSIELLIHKYGITNLPVILIDENTKITEVEKKEDITKYLF